VVVVMHGDRMSYASSLDAALHGLVEGGPPPTSAAAGLPGVPEAAGAVGTLAERASEAFENYLRLLGEQRFSDAAAELEALSRALKQLSRPPLLPEER
jgi:uncharacterized protein